MRSRAIPNVQEQITAVGALTPPSGDEAQVTKIVDTAQAALDKAKQDPSLITGNGAGEYQVPCPATRPNGSL